MFKANSTDLDVAQNTVRAMFERPAGQETSMLSLQINDDDHVQGNEAAPVTLLMYGAYECPHCVEGNRIVKQVQERFGEHLRFAFRHFPRTNVHPHAEAAAEVAEAAGEQNKFWEMHDTLFANYTRLDGESLLRYAADLRLDMERFERAITGRRFTQKVRGDLISGTDSGVRGTPTYFINGVRHFGSGQFETLVQAIEGVVLWPI
jgi:protein-disulfide isomerase